MKGSKVTLRVLNGALSVLILMLILFMMIKAGDVAYNFGYRIFTEEAVDRKPGHDMTVRLSKGMSEIELGELLEEKGLVENGLLFAAQLRLSPYSKKLKPGKYTLNTSQTATEMMQIMSGEEAKETEEW